MPWMAGRSIAALSGKPTTHLMPSRSSEPSACSARAGRRAWHARTSWPGRDGRRSWAAAAQPPEPQHGPLREAQPLLDPGHGGAHIGCREIAQRGRGRHGCSLRGCRPWRSRSRPALRAHVLPSPSTPTYDDIVSDDVVTDRSELARCVAHLKLERDAVLLYDGLAARSATRSAPTPSAPSPGTSGVMPSCGRIGCSPRAPTCRP